MKKFLALCLAVTLIMSAFVFTAGAEETKSVTYWIDIGQHDSSFNSFDELICWQEVEKNTGIDVVWEHPATNQATEQFNLIMASGQLPDIMYYAWGTSYPGGPSAAIADGKILPLEDLIEEYAPNFYAYLQAHPDIAKEVTTDEGHIYCFPMIYTYTDNEATAWQEADERPPFDETFIGLVIRKDWLDELGLEIPVTLDDWYTVLKAFQTEKGCEHPLSYVNMFAELSNCFASAYDVALPVSGYSGASAYVINEDGKVEYGAMGDGYKQYLEFMHKLYEEGLLDPDYLVQDRTTVQTKALNDEIGAWVEMMPAGIGTLVNQRLAENPDDTFYCVGVANPVATEGQQLKYKQASYPYRSAGAAITTSCQDVETALRLCDYLWSNEGNKIMNWGIEGVSYEMVDGYPALTDAMINNTEGKTPSAMFKPYYQLNGPFQVDHGNRMATKKNYSLAEGEVDESLAALDTWTYNNGTIPTGLPGGATLTTEESSEYATLFNEISTYVDEMRTKFIIGTESLDNYDTYSMMLDMMGIDRCIELQQNAVDRYNAR